MHAADEADAHALGAVAFADAHCVAPTVLPGLVRQGEALEIAGVVALAEDHRPFDLVGVQIAATPDDVTVAAAGESLLRAAPTFLLTLTCVGVDLFEHGNAVAVPM